MRCIHAGFDVMKICGSHGFAGSHEHLDDLHIGPLIQIDDVGLEYRWTGLV